jgi:hypothetical protein
MTDAEKSGDSSAAPPFCNLSATKPAPRIQHAKLAQMPRTAHPGEPSIARQTERPVGVGGCLASRGRIRSLQAKNHRWRSDLRVEGLVFLGQEVFDCMLPSTLQSSHSEPHSPIDSDICCVVYHSLHSLGFAVVVSHCD